MGVHNLGPGGNSPLSGARPDPCAYCHAPHSGLNLGLWNQKLTTQKYVVYSSKTETNIGRQPTLGYSSNQCLSCHDGTVGLIGQTVAYGAVTMHGSMNQSDILGSNMQSSHPFSLILPLKDNIDLNAALVGSHKTGDITGAVKLIGGNVECTSCHDPHVQAKDGISQNFLVKKSINGQLCLACHDPTRQLGAQVNPLADWAASQHALSPTKVSAQAHVGSYPNVAANACISCHAPHNARGAQILRGPNEGDCISCHNGGTNISPSLPQVNVFSEYAAPKIGHPFPGTAGATGLHDASEAPLLNNNRHATCVDCHNPHASAQVPAAFPPPPLIRVSQKDTAGISATDGTTPLTPAINQYENCLRCHGASSGKQTLIMYGYAPMRAVAASDPLNLIPQFDTSAVSSHPVMHPVNNGFSQLSLLPKMLDVNGAPNGRSMGTQILCTDCHNSDDNRESGGLGPNGPHGSKYTHILEHRYEFSHAGAAGGLITNLFQPPDLGINGPYGLCAKCHDLSIVMSAKSWTGHINHVNDGFTCSTCHSAHGTGTAGGSVSGERLINFDLKVVAPNNGVLSYSHAGNSCVLVCHQVAHNPGGGVSPANVRRISPLRK
jgi:predicted CXXCH cytochrome family protein